MIASGALMVLFTTGRGSVVGSAISPVIKICANPETYKKLSEDMDVNAGAIIDGHVTVNEMGKVIYDQIIGVASGNMTKSEALGHKEFILTYKTFDGSESPKALGPSCLR